MGEVDIVPCIVTFKQA